MWYHTIIHSDESRIAKQVLLAQMENEYEESWVSQLKKVALESEIDVNRKEVEKMNKPKFKKMTKEQIRKVVQKAIQREAQQKT